MKTLTLWGTIKANVIAGILYLVVWDRLAAGRSRSGGFGQQGTADFFYSSIAQNFICAVAANHNSSGPEPGRKNARNGRQLNFARRGFCGAAVFAHSSVGFGYFGRDSRSVHGSRMATNPTYHYFVNR